MSLTYRRRKAKERQFYRSVFDPVRQLHRWTTIGSTFNVFASATLNSISVEDDPMRTEWFKIQFFPQTAGNIQL